MGWIQNSAPIISDDIRDRNGDFTRCFRCEDRQDGAELTDTVDVTEVGSPRPTDRWLRVLVQRALRSFPLNQGQFAAAASAQI